MFRSQNVFQAFDWNTIAVFKRLMINRILNVTIFVSQVKFFRKGFWLYKPTKNQKIKFLKSLTIQLIHNIKRDFHFPHQHFLGCYTETVSRICVLFTVSHWKTIWFFKKWHTRALGVFRYYWSKKKLLFRCRDTCKKSQNHKIESQ